MYIDSSLDNSSISVEYDGQFPSLFRHTTGRSMNVTYTDRGMIRAVDLLDENGNVEKTRLVHTEEIILSRLIKLWSTAILIQLLLL